MPGVPFSMNSACIQDVLLPNKVFIKSVGDVAGGTLTRLNAVSLKVLDQDLKDVFI